MGLAKNDTAAAAKPAAIDFTILMPCLNEARSLPACMENARAAVSQMGDRLGLLGEILIADNGSTDGSQDIALNLGARVVQVAARGYGAALSGGVAAARGRYIVMGDADGSYDFRDAVGMVEALTRGADICMGSRFKGKIEPGAMPWKNRWIGNPVLTGILNLLFRTGISDAHCGLRAFSRGCFLRLGLRGAGMEFASEMIIKAALKGETIAEVPVTLRPDTRGRPPHLRPWRDGWRHLRYLFMLSPTWLFALPGAMLCLIAMSVLGTAGAMTFAGLGRSSFFGNYWVILAGAMLGTSHICGLLAAATHLYGVREGYRREGPRTARLSRWVSLETMLVTGLVVAAIGMTELFLVVGYWSAHNFAAIDTVLPAVVGTSLLTIGAQNVFGGFLLAILNGNEAAFLRSAARATQQAARTPEAPATASLGEGTDELAERPHRLAALR